MKEFFDISGQIDFFAMIEKEVEKYVIEDKIIMIRFRANV
jgi:hypothetical protein